jgi:HK97 family phage major capsid protein
MTLQQLQAEYAAAINQAEILKSRNADAGSIETAINKALNLRTRLNEAQSEANLNAEIQRLTGGMAGRSGRSNGGGHLAGSLGDQFVNSEVMRWLQDPRRPKSGAWSSPTCELQATTLDESSGSGGGLLITDNRPGITPLPQRPLVVADLLAPGHTDAASVTFMSETAFTNASAPVGEGQPKPESTLTFTATTEQVRKIACWLPVTDELLEDVAAIQSYIDGRLRLGIQMAEDDQLLNGNGTAPNLQGLLHRSGLTTAVVRTGSVTNADAIAQQLAAVATATNLPCDGIIMHPSNYLTIRLTKNGAGDYYGDGPFAAPSRPTLWGLPVALTTAIALGSALVGAFKVSAQLFRHGRGVHVDVSNSHSDFFVRNLTAIRCEERCALVTYRNSGMGVVSSLN